MSQRDWFEKDYYKALEVAPDASKEEIKKAYRKLAQKYHPDASGGDEARFKEISEAHAVLSNDKKREEYDEMRRLLASGGQRFFGFTPGGGGGVRINIGDIFGADAGGASPFDDLFGFTSSRARRGSDLETEVTLTFDEAVEGTTVTVGSGTKVRVPPGVADGSRVKVTGRGEAGPTGGTAGDLYVRVRVQPHPIFSQGRRGDIQVRMPVTFPEAALGANVSVPTLNGQVTVKVPAGTPHGKVLRVRGKGGPRSSGGNGDLLVKIEVEVPLKLSKKEKEALEQFAAVHKESPRPHIEAELKKTPQAS